MPTYNITNIPGALVYEKTNAAPGDRCPRNRVLVFNVLAQAGLAVGDTVQVLVPVPAWARRAWVSKRTDTANPDVLQAYVEDATAGITNYLPNSPVGTQAAAYLTSAVNSSHHVIPACGDYIRVLLTIANAVPTACRIWVGFFDT